MAVGADSDMGNEPVIHQLQAAQGGASGNPQGPTACGGAGGGGGGAIRIAGTEVKNIMLEARGAAGDSRFGGILSLVEQTVVLVLVGMSQFIRE